MQLRFRCHYPFSHVATRNVFAFSAKKQISLCCSNCGIIFSILNTASQSSVSQSGKLSSKVFQISFLQKENRNQVDIKTSSI